MRFEARIPKPEINERPNSNVERQEVEVQDLEDFNPQADREYFNSIHTQADRREGEDPWIAFDNDNCTNEQYFIVVDKNGERLGIVGAYDTEDEQNITHIVIDPSHRGEGLLPKFYQQLLNKTGKGYLIATVDPDNIASVKAHEKAGFRKISNEEYEKEYKKFKYRFDPDPMEDTAAQP